MNNPNLAVLFTTGLVIILEGCVGVIPTKETVLEGQKIDEEEQTFLIEGSTRKSDVLEKLGEPTVNWTDENIFAYNWDSSWGIWFLATEGGGDYGRIRTRNILLIQFDDKDVVSRFERTVRPMFKSYGDFLKDWASQDSRGANEKP